MFFLALLIGEIKDRRTAAVAAAGALVALALIEIAPPAYRCWQRAWSRCGVCGGGRRQHDEHDLADDRRLHRRDVVIKAVGPVRWAAASCRLASAA